MEKNQIKLDCVAERKVFVDSKTGETVPYVSLGIVLDGQFVKLSVANNSKSLFNYLFDKCYPKD